MKKNLMTIALISLISLLTTNAFAQDPALPDSVQTEILKLEAAGDFAAADNLLRQATAQAKLDARQAAAQAELEAKAKAEQAEKEAQILTDLDELLTPLPIEKCWPAATAFVDSNGYDESFVASNMALRYNLSGDYVTIEAVELAWNKRSERRQLNAEMHAIANHGDLMLAKLMEMMVVKVDSLNARLIAAETDISTLLDAKEEHDINIEALNNFVIMTDSNNEVNDDSKRRFQEALNGAKQNRKDD